MTPVWFRADDTSVEVVVAEGDAKLQRLRVDRRCVFVAFENAPPFRGLRIEADATLSAGGVAEARLAIASRYLRADAGRGYVQQRTKPGAVVRLPIASARAWDLRAILPSP